MDKIEEIFKDIFDFESNIVFFPIRHHSPSCSYHLKETINLYKPDIILIEGPQDANIIKKDISSEDSIAPFALYYSYSDTNAYISDEKEKYRCYYPFLDYSPELIAIREGKKRNIKTRFIDMSYGEILINSKEGKGLLKKVEKSNYNDDYLFEKGLFYKTLCEKENCRNFNELWEKLFEIQGLHINTQRFVKSVFSYCYLTRINTPCEELIEDSCLEREKFMACKIREFQKEYKKVLVVTGSFHTFGIFSLLSNSNEPKIHKFNKDDSKVYIMPYSMESTDMLNGYASGMPFPAFYEEVWKAKERKSHKPYEESVLKFIINTGKKVRKNEGCLSTFDEICAYNMCLGLANLRDKNECGAYELIDGIKSSFIKGDLNISTEEPLNLLSKELTGEKIGKIPIDAEVPPLVQDFKFLAEKYKLKIKSTIRNEIILEIFSKKRHREISKLFYKMKFLNTDFCHLLKGPNILQRKNVNLVRETWEYKWNISVDSALIDNSVYGGTLDEAVTSLINKKLKENSNNCSDVAKTLVEAFNMGLENVFNDEILNLRKLISQDRSFFSIMECIKHLNTIYCLREMYNMHSIDDIKDIIFHCYSKLSILIPYLAGINNEESLLAVEDLKEIYNLLLNKNLNLDKELFIESLKAILINNTINPCIEGAVLGILYGLGEIPRGEVSKAATSYILGTKEKVLMIPLFLNGVFITARDIVFIDSSILNCIDTLINSISDEEFIKIVPELRLAFSYFTPREIDEISGKIAIMYGITKKHFNELKVVSPQVLKLGQAVNDYAVKTIKEEMI